MARPWYRPAFEALLELPARLARLAGAGRRPSSSPEPVPFRPCVETLEDRRAPGDLLSVAAVAMPTIGGLAVLGDAPAYQGADTTPPADDPGLWLLSANQPGQNDLPPLPPTDSAAGQPGGATGNPEGSASSTPAPADANRGPLGDALGALFRGQADLADLGALPSVLPPGFTRPGGGGGGGGGGGRGPDYTSGGGGGGSFAPPTGPHAPEGPYGAATGASKTSPSAGLASFDLPNLPGLSSTASAGGTPATTTASAPAAAQALGQMPLRFEANQGQADPQVAFLAHGPGYTVFLTRSGQAVLDLHAADPTADGIAGDVVRMDIAGGNAAPQASGLDPVDTRTNYFQGSDPSQWVTNVANYGKVEFQNVYAGIDLDYYSSASGQLEYDFVVHPGADPAAIRLVFEGAAATGPDGQGGLLLATPVGNLDEQAPVLYQTQADGSRQTLSGGFQQMANGQVGFQVGAYDTSRDLVVDPVASYSTYLGGSALDQVNAVAVDSAGELLAAGQTSSTNFPATTGAYQTSAGANGDAFVAKLNKAGNQFLYVSYLGGSGADLANGIAVDASGDAFLTGSTTSPNFPTTTGAYQTSKTTGSDTNAFITELNASGSNLTYSTYFADHNAHPAASVGNAIALDASGDAYITGTGKVPTTSGAYQTTVKGTNNVFVSEINSNGTTLDWSTYVGGTGADVGRGIALDSSGNAYVTGSTSSTNYPTTSGAWQTSSQGGGDAFITKVDSGGQALGWSTYLGGSGADQGNGIALDGSGNLYVAGNTASTNFPTTSGAYQASSQGGGDAFVAEVTSSGSPVYATYLGGSGLDQADAIAVTAAGEAVVAGYTASGNFPTQNAAQPTYAGGGDAFAAKLAPGGLKLEAATYWGGSLGSETAYGVAVDALGAVYLGGSTASSNFPTTNGAPQTSYGGSTDGFLAKLPLKPLPASDVPTVGSCGCGGPLIKPAPNADGGNPAELGYSPAGVRYADGAVKLHAVDLSSDAFGNTWEQGRSWSNAVGSGLKGLNGNGIVNPTLPYLLASGGTNTITAVTTGADARFFDYSNGAYQERFFMGDTLTYNSSAGEYVLTDTTGDQVHYNDFSLSRPALQRGLFKSFVDPYGNVTSVTSWNTDGTPAEVQRSGGGVTESFLYTYGTSGVSQGLLTNVTLRRNSGSGWSTVQQVAYAYYDGTTSAGNAGELQTATIEDPSGNTIDTYYYRYYTPGQAGGYVGGVKYAFGPDAYRRLAAAVGNPLTATDAQVAPYADTYLQYDSQQRVTQIVVAGAGGTDGAGTGQGTYSYSYTTSTNPAGFNSWAVKTVETLPDGNQNIVYTNAYAEPMLRVYVDAGSGQQWATFDEYDSQGRIILEAAPSAVTGYNDIYADLLNKQNGVYQYLATSTGLIDTWTYAVSTTATESTPGNAAGYLEEDAVQQGQQGTPVEQHSALYFQHTGGNLTIDPVASSTVYRNTDGTGGETTSDAYTWVSGTVGMASDTTTLPVISAAQNGPGTADSQETVFDSYGRPVWSKDADGFINYTAYDPATGAVVKTITDVDTTKTGDFTGLPTGWSTPTGGGLHLITQYVVDSQGRPTEETDPNGNVNYIVYDDINHETRTYIGWNSSTLTATGPTEVMRDDLSGSYSETLTMSATPHVTNGAPDGTEAISNVQTLERDIVNAAGQVVYIDQYFNLANITYSTAQALGTINVNYYQTVEGYDAAGRPDREQKPTGTIDRSVFDGQGRVISTWVGTNDTPTSGTWSPTNNTGTANMVEISALQYDQGGVGDGDLTQQTDYPGGSAAARVSQFYFDWRDRLVASKAGVQASEDTTTHRPIMYYTLDNLGQVTATSQYNGDGVTITYAGGVPQAPSASLLRSYEVTSYDDQGRAYQDQVYAVDPNTGGVSSTALTTNDYYDHRGDLIAQSQPGGLVEKDSYDGAGRLIVSYLTDGAGGSTWANAGSVTGDNVLQQTETQYDADGNPILVTTRQRFHNETTTGALGNATNAPLARVTYVGYWYDAANRETAEADVGTNGGSAWTRPSTPPAASDTVLLTTFNYNPAGWVDTTTDPRGIAHKDLYDNLGRVVKSIDDYTDGTVTASSNKTTETTYDGDNNVLTVTADQPGGGGETTQFVYGVTVAAGSDVNSNDLLAATRYPDPSTGQPSTSQQETYTVNALGDTKTITDRNGNVHNITYDVLGRQISDTVTTLGTGVDGTVRRIDTAYDSQGHPYLFTSYADTAGTTIVNQVQDTFNGLGQLTNEYQAHSGAVNVLTTPQVQYAYTQMAGGANNSRLVSMTYPNGRVLDYNYASGVDNAVSRLTSISDNSGTLEQYKYLGLGTVVDRNHPLPGLDLTYIKQTGESNGDAGDQYTGLDRFSRVADQRWILTGSGTAADRFQYGYDRNSNPLYRADLVNHSFDELYHASGAGNGYDNLNQLSAFERGVLSASQQGGPLDTVSSPSHSQSYTLDAQGNFANVTTDGTGVTRTNNQQNEATQVGSANLTYDANGNLTTDELGQTYTYDAWNRLVQVKSGTGTVLAAYSYDPLGRRIQEASAGTTHDLYYSAAGQVLEEQVAGKANVQYVWSPVGVNILVERDRDPNGSGTLSERLWVMQDANGDVTGLVNNSGQVVERYVYDPFGAVTVLDGSYNTLLGSAYAWQHLFQGMRLDEATGNYHTGARDYRPTLSTWLQQDPIGFASGTTNLRGFVGDNPTAFTDPSGLSPPEDERLLAPGHVPREQAQAAGNQMMAPGPQGPTLQEALAGTARSIGETRQEIRDFAATNPWVRIGGLFWPEVVDGFLARVEQNAVGAQRVVEGNAGGAVQGETSFLGGELYQFVNPWVRALIDETSPGQWFRDNVLGPDRASFERGGAYSIIPEMAVASAMAAARVGVRPRCPTSSPLPESYINRRFTINMANAPVRTPNPSAPRPVIQSRLPNRVTGPLAEGEIRTPAEVAQARNYFERNRQAAQTWWEQRTGQTWPNNATHAEHPRPLANGGDPLFIEPGFSGPNAPHMVPGPDGLTDFQRWGQRGGRPPGS